MFGSRYGQCRTSSREFTLVNRGGAMAGRRQLPLEGDSEVVCLARLLRELRGESGLTLRQLARKTGYSASTLSNAEGGRRLPSWEVLEAYVQGCGQESTPWIVRWRAARREDAGGSAPSSSSDTSDVPDDTPPAAPHAPQPPQLPDPPAAGQPQQPAADRRFRVPVAAGLVVAGLAVVAALTTWVAVGLHDRSATSPSASAALPARNSASPSRPGRSGGAPDGSDPYVQHCKADETLLDRQDVRRRDSRAFGTLLLMYSPSCAAAWGYLNAPNSSAWITHIDAHRVPGHTTAPSHFSGDAAFGSWGNVLSTRNGCVYAEAYVVDRNGEGPHAKTACIRPDGPVGTAAP
ncbi:helix-turn-helix domain-containing protein [Streptomyces sp. NPDC001351]|uniref:helix-turn-helix domain-containing protein n=1 Tax=Streptomyces sp. NPDC001351 TaxID=3364564 RepID=UPI0036C1E9E6